MTDRISQIKSMLDSNPSDSFLIHALALEYRKQNDFENSQLYFEKNLELHADYLGTYHAYGQLLETFKHPQKAIDIYTKGLAVAKAQNDQKTYNELQAAIDWVDED